MITNPKDYLELGFKFHGHKCPAMPLGLKIGSIAMNILGVNRSQASELFGITENGNFHYTTCFNDGLQVITGCTFGKDNLIKSNKGKFGFTLVDRKTGRAVRITPKGEILKKSLDSKFMEIRKSGVPPQDIPAKIVDPLIENIMKMLDTQLANISQIFTLDIKVPSHLYEKHICENCGELVVASYINYRNGKILCGDCSGLKANLLGEYQPTIVQMKSESK